MASGERKQGSILTMVLGNVIGVAGLLVLASFGGKLIFDDVLALTGTLGGLKSEVQALQSSATELRREIDEAGETLKVVRGDSVHKFAEKVELLEKYRHADDILAAVQRTESSSRVLATLWVKGGEVVAKSEGVGFDSGTGKVTFPNPLALEFVPVVSSASPGTDATEMHFLYTSGPKPDRRGQFVVHRTKLNVNGDWFPPTSFTAIVIGLPNSD